MYANGFDVQDWREFQEHFFTALNNPFRRYLDEEGEKDYPVVDLSDPVKHPFDFSVLEQKADENKSALDEESFAIHVKNMREFSLHGCRNDYIRFGDKFVHKDNML